MDRPTAEYAQSDPTSVTTAAAPHYPHPPQSEGRPNPQYSHTPQPEARPANISSSNTPQPEYGLNPPPARSPAYHQDYLPRPPSFAPNSQPGGAPGMAQATSPFQPTPSAITTSSASPVPMTSSHSVAPGSLPASDSIATPRSPDPEPEATLASLPASHNFTSDAPIPLDPSLPANSPTYPPPYSPYQPQGHEMAQYQGHPPPPHQMYARPDWGHGYGQQHHGLPGPYASPAATTVSSPSSVATGGSRTGQVYSFVPIPGAQQHKRPRRRYEEIERMYKCGWNGCEKAYGTLNHLNAHVTMQSHGAKRTPEEFKEIRKEWKARKKEEESQRKAAEERERAAAQAAQAGQVDAPGSSDPSQGGPPSAYGNGVRPQLPPIGYQPADGQVQSQYGGPSNGMVYQSNGQMGYPPNYPHSPYQSGPVYQQLPDFFELYFAIAALLCILNHDIPLSDLRHLRHLVTGFASIPSRFCPCSGYHSSCDLLSIALDIFDTIFLQAF
ncbi:C2H2 finger domain transcription factor CON7 [Penicillium oxalicum]|uniref:C2H2 finger domain transcription factor CON7 n=1 Tax=Penicillium oxalicum TaxID=69781 RepID=UPI0020B7DB02|nr:C2H2 finger domain transcription factor CON7 [Penicillium oxalicum]KAI2787606.1 C2H2 finger domain transcription factor CON7 [Penicillium oxalicum]